MEKTLINHHVLVIGAGLAGTEAAHFLAQSGVRVTLIECKRVKKNPSQKTDGFAELVCTNSLKSVVEHTGHGLLKTEMDKLGSLILTIARECQVGAGDALAVDREEFSRKCTEWIEAHPLIKVVHQEVIDPIETAKQFECDKIIIATGPLTTDHLSAWIKENLAPDDFYFYDAIAPVVDAESLNYDKLYFKDRYKDDATEADYLNAPFSKIEYEQFVKAMVEAQKVPRQHFEQERFFEACLPVDLMAERGVDTPRFSCMKPVGLEQDKKNPPYAVVQLRKENLLGSAFNLVGFQNRLTY